MLHIAGAPAIQQQQQQLLLLLGDVPRPRKSEYEVEAEARDVAWVIKNTVCERLRSNIYEHQEITRSMAVTTVSMHYSKVTFNRILHKKQQLPAREERNINDVISMTGNEATRTTFVRTRPALHEDEDGCYEAEAENVGLEATLVSKTY